MITVNGDLSIFRNLSTIKFAIDKKQLKTFLEKNLWEGISQLKKLETIKFNMNLPKQDRLSQTEESKLSESLRHLLLKTSTKRYILNYKNKSHTNEQVSVSIQTSIIKSLAEH